MAYAMSCLFDANRSRSVTGCRRADIADSDTIDAPAGTECRHVDSTGVVVVVSGETSDAAGALVQCGH